MLDFQQKRKVRSVAYSRVTLIILGVLVLLSFRSIWLVYQKQRESEVLREQASAEVAELSARQTELNTDIARLQTPEGIDAAIRDKYNVDKPDENMVVIVDDQSSTTATTTSSQSLWQRFLSWF